MPKGQSCSIVAAMRCCQAHGQGPNPAGRRAPQVGIASVDAATPTVHSFPMTHVEGEDKKTFTFAKWGDAPTTAAALADAEEELI